MKYKPGSKRGSVHQVFDAEGPDAARAKAATLGVPDSKLNRWFRMWAGEAPTPARGTPVAALPTKHRGGKNQVYLVGSPHLVGTLLAEGPEQSQVKWANGNTTHVVNEWIAPVEAVAREEDDVIKRRAANRGPVYKEEVETEETVEEPPKPRKSKRARS